MRQIDADELKKVLSEPLYRSTIKDYGEILKYTFVMDIIDNAPTVEPETKVVINVTFNKEQMEELVEKAKADILAQIERPQGEWTYIGNTTISHSIKICECNQCKQRIYGAHNFCGNCGAKMKGGAE